MSWDRLPPLSTYPKARRKEMFRRIGRLLAGRPQRDLLSLEEVQDSLMSYQQSYLGVTRHAVARRTDVGSPEVRCGDECDRLAARG